MYITSIGVVGITLNCDWAEPKTDTEEDRAAAERLMQFRLGWFANPIFGNGDYPQIMKSLVSAKSKFQGFSKSRLPEFTEEEKRENNGMLTVMGIVVLRQFFIN